MAPRIESGRRIYCCGTKARPCPAHAWWYYERRGRPKLRCPLCRHLAKLEQTAESVSANPHDRCEVCGYALPDTYHPAGFCVCEDLA